MKEYYQGRDNVVIIQDKNKQYSHEHCPYYNQQKAAEILRFVREQKGKTVKFYFQVKYDKVRSLIEEAVQKLNAGEKPDLEKLLD